MRIKPLDITPCSTCGREYAIPAHDSIGVQGVVTIQVIHWPSKKVIDQLQNHNKIVATGRAFLGLLLKGATPAPTDIAVGTDATAAADGQTQLVAQVFKDSITQRIDITNGARIRFFLPTSAANGNTLKEAAILGPSPNLFMLARVTHSDIVKNDSLAVNYSWDVSFTQP